MRAANALNNFQNRGRGIDLINSPMDNLSQSIAAFCVSVDAFASANLSTCDFHLVRGLLNFSNLTASDDNAHQHTCQSYPFSRRPSCFNPSSATMNTGKSNEYAMAASI